MKPNNMIPRSANIFNLLSTKEQKALLDASRRFSFSSRKLIMREGERSRSLFIIVTGKAAVSKTDANGKRLTLAVLSPGEVVGELSLLLGQPRSADVIATTECEVAELTRWAYDRHCKKFQGLQQALLLMLGERLRETSAKLAQIAFLDVPSRLLAVIRARCAAASPSPDGALYCRMPSQNELAALIGSSREVVNRSLKLLEASGEIRREAGRVFISTSHGPPKRSG